MFANSSPVFPNELIIQIFKSIDDLPTATALGSTCRRFQSIWRTEAPPICHAVLVETITCYDQAFDYVQAQPLNAVNPKQIEDTGQLAIIVAKVFYENADIACLALRHYEVQVIESFSHCEPPGPSSLTETQRTCFLKAWYRIHTLASLSSDQVPHGMLASLDLLEFEQMMELGHWLMYCCPDDYRTELRINFHPGCSKSPLNFCQPPTSPISAERWDILMTRLSSLSRALHHSPRNNRFRKGRRMRFYAFMTQDFYPDFKKSGKAVGLADTLPLIGKRNAPSRLCRRSSWDRVR
ncbi:MAG: hypothetical protein ALECFALPRED_009723 [Alectoria fallacina]|uniref:F-box domain-containing protein n=1 Tax=Alectoria fallacina TaxID=1903189 RepID=A0A8H3J854_9LECA|nr:MAG: hypothetical protein ALECFALPRED_009723 [Alectoria fallacina]